MLRPRRHIGIETKFLASAVGLVTILASATGCCDFGLKVLARILEFSVLSAKIIPQSSILSLLPRQFLANKPSILTIFFQAPPQKKTRNVCII